MNNNFDIAIIGAGVAGMSAALVLDSYDVNVCLIDENENAGGQFVKYNEFKKVKKPSPLSYKQGLEKVDNFKNTNITYLKKHEVIFINDEKELVLKNEKEELFSLKPKVIILAIGAREIVHPFKGWDLPGVITTGALQILLKTSNRTFEDEITFAGTGILPYAAAATHLQKGGKIGKFYDYNSFLNKLSLLQATLTSSAKFADFIGLLPKMIELQKYTNNSYEIIEAKGQDKLESIVLAKKDSKGEVIISSIKEEKTSFLAIGDGLLANLDVAILAGCETTYCDTLGGLLLKINKKLETSIEGLFASGAAIGVGGADKSVIEGELCAYSSLLKLGIIDDAKYDSLTTKLFKQREKALIFTKILASMQKANLVTYKNLDESTVICRCEDINVKQIKDAIDRGFLSINSIKKRTRAGMGPCQGKTCAVLVRNILSSYGIKDLSATSIRPPLRPTSIKTLAGDISELRVDNITWNINN